jgi:hypothetical protein
MTDGGHRASLPRHDLTAGGGRRIYVYGRLAGGLEATPPTVERQPIPD